MAGGNEQSPVAGREWNSHKRGNHRTIRPSRIWKRSLRGATARSIRLLEFHLLRLTQTGVVTSVTFPETPVTSKVSRQGTPLAVQDRVGGELRIQPLRKENLQIGTGQDDR
jgi:hypothetical protein